MLFPPTGYQLVTMVLKDHHERASVGTFHNVWLICYADIQNLQEPMASHCWNKMTSRWEDVGMSSRHARKLRKKIKGPSTSWRTFLLLFKRCESQMPWAWEIQSPVFSWRFLFKYQRDPQVAYRPCELASSMLPAATSQLRPTQGQHWRRDSLIFCIWLPERTSSSHNQSGPTAGTQTAQEVSWAETFRVYLPSPHMPNKA